MTSPLQRMFKEHYGDREIPKENPLTPSPLNDESWHLFYRHVVDGVPYTELAREVAVGRDKMVQMIFRVASQYRRRVLDVPKDEQP